jgi:hypothetical protein
LFHPYLPVFPRGCRPGLAQAGPAFFGICALRFFLVCFFVRENTLKRGFVSRICAKYLGFLLNQNSGLPGQAG